MSNVTAMRSEFVTPAQVLDGIVERIDSIEDIYVITWEHGEPVMYGSGNLKRIASAALVLQAVATEVVMEPEKFNR